MDLLEMNVTIPAEASDAADFYLRRLGALGVAVEDPEDARAIARAQAAGDADASLFFDPSYLDDLTDQALMKAWFRAERAERGDLGSPQKNLPLPETKEALASAVFLEREGKDHQIFLRETPAELFFFSEEEETASGAGEDLTEHDLSFGSLFPQAGGRALCEEKHDLGEALDILGKELANCLQFFGEAGTLCPKFRFLEERDWAEAYKRHYDILRLGRHIVVCPSWKEAQLEPGERLISLDPESAFGTGMHATTALCVSLIEDMAEREREERGRGDAEVLVSPKKKPEPELRILDLGTGSGILAIAAALCFPGRPQIEACDIDGNALRVAQNNLKKNGQEQIRLFCGSLDAAEGAYDCLIANLISDLQLRFAETYCEKMKPGSILIASGVIEEREEEVRTALEAAGLHTEEIRRDRGWIAFLMRKSA